MLRLYSSRAFHSSRYFFGLFLIYITFSISCTHKSGRSFLPHIAGYNERQKKVIVLPKKLLEISGMYYQQDGKIAAINDEDGKLFIIHLQHDSVKKSLPNDSVEMYRFGDKGDFEDIVYVDSTYYIMESTGNIHEVKLQSKVPRVRYKFRSAKRIEFESLYFSIALNKLILITKDHRRKDQGIFSYSFDLATKEYSKIPHFFIPTRDVYAKLRENINECKPSAAAIHPKLNKIFIIASVGKILMQCNLDGEVEKAYRLNPGQFPQPEGITFAPNGDMYISNEGLQGKATILKFPYMDPQVVKK